uniref:Uncharacterized protein n=1 Tax=Meloidogyne enterolobii TaxID=390850 RepID=A0A6V7V129_MELEN|nr:unnamed protein product [Meloidogyne enterolobii]
MFDHSILNELAGNIILTQKYLGENIVELIDTLPPHPHGELTSAIYKRCQTRVEELYHHAQQDIHDQQGHEHTGHQERHHRGRAGRQHGSRRRGDRGRNGGGRQ